MNIKIDAEKHNVALECKGFMDDSEGLRLFELAYQYAHLGPILEIGSYCGKSSVYLGAGAQLAGGTLVCIDHHRGSEEHQRGEEYHDPDLYDESSQCFDSLGYLRQTIHAASLEDTAVLIVAKSVEAAKLWRVPLGLLFIDGGHSHVAAQTDYQSWAPKVASGGILAIHDLFPDPQQGGQAPIEIYRQAIASGHFEELPTTKTLGVLKRKEGS